MYSGGVAEPDRSAAQWVIFRHWVAIFILQKYSSVPCWQAISFYKCVTQTRFCSLSHSLSNFCLFLLICSYDSLEEGNVFYFGSCIRYFNSQIFSVTQFIHLSAAAYTSLLIVFHGKLLQITELNGGKREMCALQALFMGPFSFWLYLLQISCFICVCVCVSLSHPARDWHYFVWAMAA